MTNTTTTFTKDPWCCVRDKLTVSENSFNRGYLHALTSARILLKTLSKEDNLAVLDELLATAHTEQG